MVELVTRMMELKKQQARAPKKQSPSGKQLLGKCGTLPIIQSDVKARHSGISDCRL
jgi:hypothetical protein